MTTHIYSLACVCSLAIIVTMGCGETRPRDTASTASVETQDRIESANAVETFLIYSNHSAAESTQATTIKRALLEAIDGTPSGSWWHLVTQNTHQHLVSFQVPEGSRQKRFRQLSGVLAEIHAEFDAPAVEQTGQVNLPALAATVKRLKRTEYPCRIGIFGEPRYLNEEQRAFTHDGPNATKDGSVGHAHSPFQVTTQLPSGTLVNWVSPTAEYGVDAKHREAIRHFNGYYIQEIGGHLLRTTDDPSLLFLFNKPASIARIEPKHDSVGKYAATERTEAVGDDGIDTVAFSVEDIEVPGADQVDSPEATFAAAEENKGSIAFGINWTCADPSCDIDMYVASNGLPGELCYLSPQLSWGKHFRDVTSSAARDPNVEDYKNWEWCRIDHARLHDLVLHLNVFRTTAPVRVTIVRVWNGERKVRVVTLDVTKGDGGRERANRRASQAWQRFAVHGITEHDEPGIR